MWSDTLIYLIGPILHRPCLCYFFISGVIKASVRDRNWIRSKQGLILIICRLFNYIVLKSCPKYWYILLDTMTSSFLVSLHIPTNEDHEQSMKSPHLEMEEPNIEVSIDIPFLIVTFLDFFPSFHRSNKRYFLTPDNHLFEASQLDLSYFSMLRNFFWGILIWWVAIKVKFGGNLICMAVFVNVFLTHMISRFPQSWKYMSNVYYLSSHTAARHGHCIYIISTSSVLYSNDTQKRFFVSSGVILWVMRR